MAMPDRRGVLTLYSVLSVFPLLATAALATLAWHIAVAFHDAASSIPWARKQEAEYLPYLQGGDA
jgi:hypothetical protein